MSFNNFGNEFFNDPFFNDPFFNDSFNQMNHRQRGSNPNMALTQNNGHPMDMMSQFHNNAMSMFNDGFGMGMLGGMGMGNSMFFGSDQSGNSGNVSVEDRGDHYKLALEIYNLDKSSLEFHVDPSSRQVSIQGSITNRQNSNGFTSVSTESFSRSFPLPVPSGADDSIDDSGASASYDNNVLTIRIPKIKLKRISQDNSESEYEIVDEVPKIQEIN